ncbi:probable ubiquitin-like-specific protease 2A isoform X3 [Quercus robur]|uniref:probable ubiquitin-like-specific protease 2A isoform X3 n=1 Tax=Quercus robur TaxID=38942 RepID=UPI0021633407|nr:probable ubiquitin-like-specific protease 2A isoform X3 [Quercus robur]
MSRSSSGKRFDVFEFAEEDEQVEKASQRFLGMFGNPKKPKPKPPSPLSKYTFLQCFAQDTETPPKEINNAPIDIDAEVSRDTKTPLKEIRNAPIDIDAEETKSPQKEFDVASQRFKTLRKKVGTELLDIDASDTDHQCPMELSIEDGTVRVETPGLDTLLLSSSSNSENKEVGMASDYEDNIGTCSSTSASSPAIDFSSKLRTVSLEEQVSEYGSGGYEIDIVNMTVHVFPDFLIYGDIYCTKCRLTFSNSSIKLEGSTVNGLKEIFSFEWAVGAITKIESEWFGRVETAVVNLHLKSRGSKGAGNAKETSGVELLTFATNDPHWSIGEEAIKSLDVRYKNMWNVIFDFDEPFKDVFYPEGDPDAVCISKRDIELLQPERFINDTIIDFYIKHLKNKIQPGEEHRYHFFNSFFFRKLADLDKDPSSACEGRAAFQRVRKWTRKVNLFTKDYIFIPVNYSLHWSLIVICYPGEVDNFKDEDIENLPKVPCILHMDSIRGSHRGLKNLFQSYLCEEWKERHGQTAAEVSSKFLHLRFVSLELPQQENSFDCGLFLLHYVELFLEEAPINFNPFRITMSTKFCIFFQLNVKWFPPEEASLKRACIRKLIYEILEDHSKKAPLADCNDKNPCHSQETNTNLLEIGVEFLEGTCISANSCHGEFFGSDDKQRFEISNAVSPPRVQNFKELGFFLREVFEPGTTGRSFSDGNYQKTADHHGRSIMSPIEEGEEICEQIAESLLDVEDCQRQAVFASELPSTSCFGKDFKELETSWKQGFSKHLGKPDEGNSLSGMLIGGSQYLLPETEGVNHLEKTDKPQSSSTSSEELMACVVEDSLEANDMYDQDESKNSPSNQRNIISLSDQEVDSVEIINVKENISPSSDEDPEWQLEEEQVEKRLKRVRQCKRQFARSLSKQLHY